MVRVHFLKAAARITRMVHFRQSACPSVGREVRTLVNASSKGGDWRTMQAEMPSPKVTLPGPFVTPPSPVLPVTTRWLLTSVESAECEQGVLYGCGPAQVGFGTLLSSFHGLTLSSKGKLRPKPLRLTHPVGVSETRRLRHQLVDHLAGDVGQAEVAALEAVGELRVVETQKAQ